MLKRYLPFLLLGPVANLLWAFWALADINEQGTLIETLQWIAVQAAIPALFCLLLRFRRRYVHYMLLVYGGFMLLFGFGIAGWALMGESTPVSVYAVCFTLAVMGFGILYRSMEDLHLGKKEIDRYEIKDE